jgi:hypothetical protein
MRGIVAFLILISVIPFLFGYVRAVGEEESDGESDGADSTGERVHGMVEEQIAQSGTGISKRSLQRYDTFISPQKKWMKVSLFVHTVYFMSYYYVCSVS